MPITKWLISVLRCEENLVYLDKDFGLVQEASLLKKKI